MGSAINLNEIKRYEVTEVYTHPDAKVDIVFVHGLNGDPRQSWTAKNGVFWPTQLLPTTLKSAQARILVYGYNADVYAFGNSQSASSDMIHHHAQTLLTNLTLERRSEEVSDHPIIFVAHSLGGILIKRALEMSEQYRGKSTEDLRSIFVSTYGLMFLGTPHNGADPAKWGMILQGMVSALVPKKFMDTEAPLVKTLQKNNETLQNINLAFLEIVKRFKVSMVHEAVKTDLHGTKAFIVDKDSAAPLLPDVWYFGIEANHSQMCKFESKNSPGYLNVSTTIKSWVQECVPVIRARQNFEATTVRMQKQADASALVDGYEQQPTGRTPASTPDASINNSTITVIPTFDINPELDDGQTPRTPYFIKPSGLRPNSLFVGRQSQLEEMHKILFDEKRRRDGTSAILIQSMPGGGKTHLAREFVYTHRDEFSGGVFWVRAKSQTEFAAGYWDIARKAALKHLSKEDINATGGDAQQFMKMVKKWLNRRQKWLMVIDGIHFDTMEEVQKYIPDSKDTCLIYTSTEKAVSGDYHWMNPQIIRLPLLSAREAQELLLLELDKSTPFLKEDLKHSMELVQAMGFLPVAIHSVAQRLKTTGEPLTKFARSFASEPRLRGLLGTYVAVVEDLNMLAEYEALNLMYILCFFSQHIPVEMISLGLKALDELHIPVKARHPFSGRSLNNTFIVLNRFALIDRNEHDLGIQSSQSSQRSKEMLADNIDVIRLHSVVQAFFADSLHEDKNLTSYFKWLGIAVRLFCCSYDMAGARIVRKTNTGLVEDYRLYEIHGIRLREHCTKHEKKTPMLETIAMLDARLGAIKQEIDRRTPESSSFIARGGGNASQTSIFDRTSSSSDTNPDTPGESDKGGLSKAPTWVFDPDQEHHSPIEIRHQDLGPNPMFKQPFPPHIPDDDGYDSDLENTALPSPRTIKASGSPNSPGGIWEKVLPRRKPRVSRFELGDHRTTRTLERQKYSDRAGSFRAIEAVDPRAARAQISRETAHGYVQNSSSRAPSRGRMSGQSHAVAALAHISATSPPPARGGGAIHDRRPLSQRSADRRRLVAGAASYAAAVSGFARDAVFEEAGQTVKEQPVSPQGQEPPPTQDRPQSTAMQSLQQFPTSIIQLPASPQVPFTPMPPYPPTPGLKYQVDHPGSDVSLFQLPERYNQENQDPSSNIYPRLTGPVPLEKIDTSVPGSRRYSGQGYPGNELQNNQERLESSANTAQCRLLLSLSSPNIRIGEDIYHPGYPEFSSHTQTEGREGGYTSQPMSRDPSGQSTHSDQSHHDTQDQYNEDMHRRRPSLAETEPPPTLPDFSPRIAPTSYEVYERMRDVREERVMTRRGSRLEVSRVRERLEEWTTVNDQEKNNQAPRRSHSPFNPAAPPFIPSGSSFARSPNIPNGPPNSVFSNPSYTVSPLPRQSQNTSPRSFQSAPAYPPPQRTSPPFLLTHSSAPYPQPPQTTPPSFSPSEGRGGDEMARTGSGGVRIGQYVIEFGDFPEPVEVRQARERAGRARAALALNGNRNVGLGISEGRLQHPQ